MTTYAVYQHKVFGKKAVKNGFSAGGFFFPLIWSLMHKTWWLAAVLFPWGMIAAAMDSALSNVGGNGPGGALFAQFIFYHLPAGLIFGFAGNGLLRAALEKQGYSKVQDLEAQSPEDALAKSSDAQVTSLQASADKGPLNRSCPYCAETIKSEAKICRFCQRDLPAHSNSTNVVRPTLQTLPDESAPDTSSVEACLEALGRLGLEVSQPQAQRWEIRNPTSGLVAYAYSLQDLKRAALHALAKRKSGRA